MTWQGEPPRDRPLSRSDRVRALGRGLAVGSLVFGGLALHLALRLPERAVHGAARPWTSRLTQRVCRGALRLLGLDHSVRGRPMQGPGALVANHAGWLDIFALNAADRIVFVAKEEVAGWAGIGWLARATGTVFIRRDPRAAAEQVATFRERLALGHRLLFFPEGTSTDGLRVLPFRTTLFAAFLSPGAGPMRLQPVTLRYTAPEGEDARFYGWYGEMDFLPHLVSTLAARRQGRVEVIFHEPVDLAPGTDRKALARRLQATVAGALGP